MKYELYVGSYAAAEETGIYKYELDTEQRILKRLDAVKGIENPSYLSVHSNGRTMYSVEELTPDGNVAVFSLDKMPEYLYSLSSEGSDPCHLSLDEKEEFLFVSNYTSGSIGVFRLDQNGRPAELTDHKQHTGRGKNPARQEGPHVHFSAMNDGLIYVCDLGLDRIVCYELNRETGKLLRTEKDIDIPEGFGPRHIALHHLHQGYMYVVGELTGEVAVLKKDVDKYTVAQMISSLSDGFEGENTAAAVKFSKDGKLLFVSNRGSDSITSFIVQGNGMLETADMISCGGKGPRDFEIFEDMILVANQYTDNITAIEYSRETGKMKMTSVCETVSKPVMILGRK